MARLWKIRRLRKNRTSETVKADMQEETGKTVSFLNVSNVCRSDTIYFQRLYFISFYLRYMDDE